MYQTFSTLLFFIEDSRADPSYVFSSYLIRARNILPLAIRLSSSIYVSPVLILIVPRPVVSIVSRC